MKFINSLSQKRRKYRNSFVPQNNLYDHVVRMFVALSLPFSCYSKALTRITLPSDQNVTERLE